MTETVITSAIAYASTNIDDIFILMLLFAQANVSFRRILLGKYIGIGVLTAVSLLGALGLGFVPQEYIRFLGIAPILLGIKAFFDGCKKKIDDSEKSHAVGSAVLNTALVTIANGADNIGVYIPLFVGYSLSQTLVAVLIFALMTLLWCILGGKMANLPFVKKTIEKHKHIAVPILYIILGIYILIF